jgi:translation initiation factor 4G
MEMKIRRAAAADAPFLAWVQQEAARSHLPQGFWDHAFPGTDADRLRVVGRICTAATVSFCHWSGFLVAELDGTPAAGLSAYTNASTNAGTAFLEALTAALDAERWDDDARLAMNLRIAPFLTCLPDTADETWVVEWVATKPAHRGKGLVRALLEAILDEGRRRGHARSQIAVLIGNTPAQRAYESAGFRVFDEKTDPEFERLLGSPGIRRLMR